MITKKDHKMRKLGRRLLHLSSHPNYSLVALLSRAGNILSIGINKKGNPPGFVEKTHSNMGIHAEANCLTNIPKKRSRGATLYVVGQSQAGSQILTRPCQSCMLLICAMGIKRVVYEDIWGDLREIKL